MSGLETHQYNQPGELASAVASVLLQGLDDGSTGSKPFSVALSGGRITETLFLNVVKQIDTRLIDFGNIHFFWADERCVPPDHAESNYKLANKRLFGPLGVPDTQIHRVRGEDPPLSAAAAAESELRQLVVETRDGQPVLDLVLLGMGEDGHVASLFPDEPESWMDDAAVYRAIFDSPKPPPERVTLGYRAIAAAKEVWVLVSGQGKESALRASLKPGSGTPLGRVLSMRSKTRLFTDIEMAGGFQA